MASWRKLGPVWCMFWVSHSPKSWALAACPVNQNRLCWEVTKVKYLLLHWNWTFLGFESQASSTLHTHLTFMICIKLTANFSEDHAWCVKLIHQDSSQKPLVCGLYKFCMSFAWLPSLSDVHCVLMANYFLSTAQQPKVSRTHTYKLPTTFHREPVLTKRYRL